jgi:hypothetical protein
MNSKRKDGQNQRIEKEKGIDGGVGDNRKKHQKKSR